MESRPRHLPRRFKPDPAAFTIINIVQDLEESYGFSIGSNCSTCSICSIGSIGSNCSNNRMADHIVWFSGGEMRLGGGPPPAEPAAMWGLSARVCAAEMVPRPLWRH